MTTLCDLVSAHLDGALSRGELESDAMAMGVTAEQVHDILDLCTSLGLTVEDAIKHRLNFYGENDNVS